MRKTILIALFSALALALATSACSGDGDAAEEGASAGVTEATASALRASAGEAAEGGGESLVAAKSAAEALPAFGPKVIQTASIRLSVPRNQFDQKVRTARTIATGFGGFVVSSSASKEGTRRLVSGMLVLRIPAERYARAIDRLSELGKVEGREESGQDVSQEYVDLESRARHLRAVETQLLELLQRARSVPAALAVQSQLSQVQLELEQAQGRLRYLDDQVSFATIALDIRERNVEPKDDSGGWGIVDAWSDGARGFVQVAAGAFVVFATALPVVLLLGLAYIGFRIARRRGLEPDSQ